MVGAQFAPRHRTHLRPLEAHDRRRPHVSHRLGEHKRSQLARQSRLRSGRAHRGHAHVSWRAQQTAGASGPIRVHSTSTLVR